MAVARNAELSARPSFFAPRTAGYRVRIAAIHPDAADGGVRTIRDGYPAAKLWHLFLRNDGEPRQFP